MTLRVVADANIADLDAYFGDVAELTQLDARQLTAADLVACDVLLVRSVTRVDEDLLHNTPVRAVASATSGIDHIDLDYLASRDIFFCHAPGSNADSVVDYVFSALAACDNTLDKILADGSVGIVGCGQVGGRLLDRLQRMGVLCRIYDPFLQEQHAEHRCDLDAVLGCDVVCLHTPLTRQGAFPTYHQLGDRELASLSEDQLLINAGRGPTVDENALRSRLSRADAPKVVLDVWETEPHVSRDLLALAHLGSAHIAGYSLTGKRRATRMLRNQLEEGVKGFSGFGAMDDSGTPTNLDIYRQTGETRADVLRRAIFQVYDVREDDKLLRESLPRANDAALAI